jgi:hypothetical protein
MRNLEELTVEIVGLMPDARQRLTRRVRRP